MGKSGKRLIRVAKEARVIARGESEPASLTAALVDMSQIKPLVYMGKEPPEGWEEANKPLDTSRKGIYS
jgi:hypothetical protein